MMKNSKKVSLIMPVLNEENSVEYTLNAVFSSTRLPDEIVVADAFSSDQTQTKIMQFKDRGVPIIIVNNSGIYAGAGRNVAVDACTGDIVLLLDFGNIVDKKWIEEMVVPFEKDDSVDSVAGAFKPLTQSDYESCVAAIQYFKPMAFNNLSREEQEKVLPKCVKPGGLGLAIKKDLWHRLGGMPSWLRAGEDYIFSRKVCACELNVHVALDAFLHHHIRSNCKQVFKQNFVYKKGSAQIGMIGKNEMIIAGVYSTLFVLLLTSIVMPINLLFFFLLFFLYVYRFGVSQVLKIYKKPPKNYCLYALEILVVGNMGSLLGSISGWFSWIREKQFKNQFNSYFNTNEFERIKKCRCSSQTDSVT